MQEFADYVESLKVLLKSGNKAIIGDFDSALDGQPGTVLRRVVPIQVRRASGAFPTGSMLARRLFAPVASTLREGSVVFDPTCGTGDLLLAAAEHLSVEETLSQTLRRWSRRLAGCDIEPEFVAASVARIALAAARRGARVDGDFTLVARLLAGIRTRSCLDNEPTFQRATHLVMNPPFTLTRTPAGCPWATGLVNSAAIFLDYAIGHARPSVTVSAILPDVLRSGSRYGKWRRHIEARLDVAKVEVVGRFAPDVDVDVFLLVGETTRVRPNTGVSHSEWTPESDAAQIVGDLFDVGVGALVPHRDLHQGPWRPVVAPRQLPPWGIIRSVDSRRRFSGSTVDGPFVAIRRTSRPGDTARAVGTVIAVDEPVVVENHLIVLRPRDQQLRTCQRLLASLQLPDTTTWLDQRIRCRHLTGGALRTLPIWTECAIAPEPA